MDTENARLSTQAWACADCHKLSVCLPTCLPVCQVYLVCLPSLSGLCCPSGLSGLLGLSGFSGLSGLPGSF